ncbi:efflux RND transporter periplasmic adaptor subunit [Ichthyobacterium seriolicida]|uniref:RND family efflux transporter MFP subunit n=1 Tax=Ichthyobacterium seriolicida TaxID=242600 RepID=A0A1J1DW44_9FLAO|nr:efflux RND transporter periplasmic adaptor subunit [Ichthyobacterium seriolicida]BAV94082.1 RND family efflux transporter MFP subunit [Ichthyobacterium seriolicida]
MKNINKKQLLISILLLLIGIYLGKIFFGSENKENQDENKTSTPEKQSIWTCSMHPQIKQKNSGKCPLCGMDLTILEEEESTNETSQLLELNQNSMTLANIQTSKVEYDNFKKEFYLNGKVIVDERKISTQTAHFDGKVEKLYINFTGEKIVKGQKIIAVYSPQIVTAQEELLESIKYKDENLIPSVKRKLDFWRIDKKTIDKIIKTKSIIRTFDVISDFEGIVTYKNVNIGDHVDPGTTLYKIADLSKLWIVFDAYEKHIKHIHKGDEVEITFDVPGLEKITSKVAFIDPVINEKTRVAKVRVEIENFEDKILPEMFTTGKFVSFRKKKKLKIPKTAVLWTGKQSIVYLKTPDSKKHSFKAVEVSLYDHSEDYYFIKSGLNKGDEIVINGAFTIDAAAQLQGKNSMMNQITKSESSKKKYRTQASDKLKSEIKKIYYAYLGLKNTLAEDDVKKTSLQIKKLNTALSDISSYDSKKEFKSIISSLKNQVGKMLNLDNDIEKYRKHFLQVSESMIQIIGMFKMGEEIYLNFCSMADNNKGAYWLSDEKDIKNPYFGSSMLRCGEIKKVYN